MPLFVIHFLMWPLKSYKQSYIALKLYNAVENIYKKASKENKMLQ